MMCPRCGCYRLNPSITIAVKRPGFPLITVNIDSGRYREEIKKIIGAEYELNTLYMYGHYEDAPALFMAVDEYGFYKKELDICCTWRGYPVKGTAVFFKADGRFESLNQEDLAIIRKEIGELNPNPGVYRRNTSLIPYWSPWHRSPYF